MMKYTPPTLKATLPCEKDSVTMVHLLNGILEVNVLTDKIVNLVIQYRETARSKRNERECACDPPDALVPAWPLPPKRVPDAAMC